MDKELQYGFDIIDAAAAYLEAEMDSIVHARVSKEIAELLIALVHNQLFP